MARLVSFLSEFTTSVIPFSTRYTSAFMVSEITGGEILAEEIELDWISWAADEIARKTGQRFHVVPFEDVLDGNGLDIVFTLNFPLIQVAKVEMDSQILSPLSYAVNLRTGSVRLRQGIFNPGIRNVVVTGTYGYQNVPPLIQKVATLLVAKTALSAKNGPLIDNESIGDFSQTRTFKKLNDELDRAWEALGRRFPIDFI
ncbi:MAG: hypothetical protein HYT79_02540 [Elusimicrobia bacterium]|nr:hypothetical protein [Elusimicrobiota bacterium]